MQVLQTSQVPFLKADPMMGACRCDASAASCSNKGRLECAAGENNGLRHSHVRVQTCPCLRLWRSRPGVIRSSPEKSRESALIWMPLRLVMGLCKIVDRSLIGGGAFI
jgi:hypothetical protein